MNAGQQIVVVGLQDFRRPAAAALDEFPVALADRKGPLRAAIVHHEMVADRLGVGLSQQCRQGIETVRSRGLIFRNAYATDAKVRRRGPRS